jgi:Tfp pilus assembly protein PilF
MTQPDLVARLEQMLAGGKETALLQFSLGNEYVKRGDHARAAEHLRRAVELDPKYSAAWKILGRALAGDGQAEQALAAYRQGIAVAEAKGDKQASKEMGVFARRIERTLKGES